MLSGLPELRTLSLSGAAPSNDFDQALTASALSSLTHLEALALLGPGWLPLLQPGGSGQLLALASQLKYLQLGGAVRYVAEGLMPSPNDIAAAVRGMSALEELHLGDTIPCVPRNLHELLRALPPSATLCEASCVTMAGAGRNSVAVRCVLEGEWLQECVVTGTHGVPLAAAALGPFLEALLAPPEGLRLRGPALRLLDLDLTLDLGASPAPFGPKLAPLLSQCGQVRLRDMCGGSTGPEAVLEAAQLLGLPRRLSLSLGKSDTVLVRLELPPDSAAADPRAGAGKAGGYASARLPSAPLAPAEVLKRALRAMEAEPGAAGRCSQVLLCGPAMAKPVPGPVLRPRLRSWLQPLVAKVPSMCAAEPGAPLRSHRLQVLPSAGAGVLRCGSTEEARALAHAAEQASARAQAGGAPAGPALRTVAAAKSLGEAVGEVLEALWDGTGEGGPSGDVHGLERLRWLLSTLASLQGLLVEAEVAALCATRISGAAPGAGRESEVDRRTREAQLEKVQMLAEKQKAEGSGLLAALMPPLPAAGPSERSVEGALAGMAAGFHNGQPEAAVAIFRYCLHTRAFQAARTTIFDSMVSVIKQEVERSRLSNDNNGLTYWLSNTATLLHMLNKYTKPASGRVGPGFRYTAAAADAEASAHKDGAGGTKHVMARRPALLFKKEVDAFVQKIFPMIRDNVRKEISPMLKDCALQPKAVAGGSQQVASHKAWTDMLHAFDKLLGMVKAHHVPKVLVQALFKQLFRFANVQLFNELTLRRQCCSFANGEYLKAGLEQVAHWIDGAGADYVAGSWKELEHLCQAVTLLLIGDKPNKSLEDWRLDLCPVLSIQQLYRLYILYWEDRGLTGTASWDVLAQMKQAMVDSNGSASYSFLLDNDSSLPFQAAELLANMDDKDLYGAPMPDGDLATSFASLRLGGTAGSSGGRS